MATEHDSLLGERKSPRAETLTTLFQSPSTEGSSTLVPTFKEEQGTNAVPISYKNGIEATAASAKETKKPARSFIALADCSTMAATLTGSFVFLTYHVVFCLTQAATIAPTPRATGLLARAAALGTLTAAPVFVYNLGSEIPAIYPASDLFLAPFLAELAYKIQAALDDMGLGDNDEYFLATFLFVSGFGMVLSGCCCILAARFKLANLGAFLPYSVLCGFFTTIGFLMYSLSVVVDTGLKIGQIVTCNDMDVIGNALLHHIPSLIVGITMHVLGRKFPSLVILLIFATILGAYVILWITSTTLQEAQEAKWFFSVDDLVPAANNNDGDSHGSLYGPPMPFGLLFSIWRGSVIWKAAFAGTPTILALVFLYVIRSSLHSAALRKNIPNVTRKVAKNSSERAVDVSSPTAREEKKRRRKRKKEVLALGNILESGYAYSQLAAALFGGITVAPSIAASLTMFQLGAERSAPQYGSFALLFIFYLTDFSPAQCCPKPAFSCLMVLAGLDMSRTWIVGSFFKTKDKFEWAVAPFLVVMAFTVGMLNAILLGVAMSTFIFAANFYRAGTVKFVGSGITLRAPVERRQKELAWLDQNADLTQILILQNYLFFGNAQSVQNYVTTMFDDDDLEDVGDGEQFTNEDFPLPPVPKILIVSSEERLTQLHPCSSFLQLTTINSLHRLTLPW